MNFADAIVFAAYFIGIVVFAVLVAAKDKRKGANSYFLASRKLPWYVVGASFIAANISTEHFIGMIGWTYLYGMAVCHWSWLNAATYTILIWVFLPFYMRGNVCTMPEFLELRYNKVCRYFYATVSLVGMVISMLGGVMYAGGKAINVFFPGLPVTHGIVILAVAAGIYTVYGGLLSAAWADLVQYCLLMLAGFVVLFTGLYYVGGWGELVTALPEKFIMFYPATHESIPWVGILSAVFTVGIWYSSANQFMVQRCLGARSEWDARMGVVMSGFSQAILPAIIVVPGLIGFLLFHGQVSDGDQIWPYMVMKLLPTGVVGLVLAGLASAVMSTLSAITTSSSTLISLDIYRSVFRPQADDSEMHKVGRIASASVMLIGMLLALIMANYAGITVFGLIQTVFFYVAGPIASIFLIGILWSGATSTAGAVALILGFTVYLPISALVLFPRIEMLKPYDNFMYHTLGVWIMTAITLVAVSLFTKPKSRQELRGVVWTRDALRISQSGHTRRRSLWSLAAGWGAMVGLIAGLYVYTGVVGSRSRQFEAEKLTYQVTPGSVARIQQKSEVTRVDKGFNLWTNSSQLLFAPDANEARLTLEVPIEQSGNYLVDAVVTVGPDYGGFRVHVDGKPSTISYSETEESESGKRFRVVAKQTDVFDSSVTGTARRIPSGVRNATGAHVVQRLSFGPFPLQKGTVRLCFVAESVSKGRSLVGVDQIFLTEAQGRR